MHKIIIRPKEELGRSTWEILSRQERPILPAQVVKQITGILNYILPAHGLRPIINYNVSL